MAKQVSICVKRAAAWLKSLHIAGSSIERSQFSQTQPRLPQVYMSAVSTASTASSGSGSNAGSNPPERHGSIQHAMPGQPHHAARRGSVPGAAMTIGFLGGGMMASALIKGLLKAEIVPSFCISVSDPDKPTLDKLKGEGINTYESNSQVLEHAHIIVIAVKPDVVQNVLRELSPRVTKSHLIISIAAGITLQSLQHALPDGTRIVRVMPNTPCRVGACAAAFATGAYCHSEDTATVKRLFHSVGVAVEVKEKDLNAVTGLSGSGPAYIFLLIEALADGGVRAGLSRTVAMQLAAQTVKGAASMVQASGDHPGVLKDQVASPGGTTIAGIEALEKGNFRATIMSAVVAATERAKQLSDPQYPVQPR